MNKNKIIQEEIKKINENIQEYFLHQPVETKAIIGMSGGKDSTITATLLVKALGADRVIGVSIPENNNDILAKEICDYLKIQYIRVDIGKVMNEFYTRMNSAASQIDIKYDAYEDKAMISNAPARARMMVLYGVATLFPHARVINTSNYSENCIGYFTKFGDNCGDFGILNEYTVSEILAIGDALGLPTKWVHKPPSDDMCGDTDEERFGFTYEELDKYLFNREVKDFATREKIVNMYTKSRHKINPMPTCSCSYDFRRNLLKKD